MAVAVGVAVGVGVLVGVVVPPVQVVPLSAKDAGTGLVPDQVPLKPNDALASVARDALYETFFAVTAAPLCDVVAFQACVTAWPAVNDHVRVQALTGSPRLVSLTSAPNPVAHWLVTA